MIQELDQLQMDEFNDFCGEFNDQRGFFETHVNELIDGTTL